MKIRYLVIVLSLFFLCSCKKDTDKKEYYWKRCDIKIGNKFTPCRGEFKFNLYVGAGAIANIDKSESVLGSENLYTEFIIQNLVKGDKISINMSLENAEGVPNYESGWIGIDNTKQVIIKVMI